MKYLSEPGHKITATLFVAQSLVTGGIIAVATVLTIVGTRLSGNPSWAGIPSAVIQLAAAPAAFIWGVVWDRIGRRNGMALGIGLGVLGLALSLAAIQWGSFLIFLFGLVGLGFARAAMQLGRFVAAEVNPPDVRGRAIAYVVLGGTVGAVGGPLVVGQSSVWAQLIGLDGLAGPFGISVVLLSLTVVFLWAGLRPEPLVLSRQVAREHPEQERQNGDTRRLAEILRRPAVIVSITAVVFAQMVMIMVMGITSLHMDNLDHTLGNISLVFSAHTLGMFAFSLLSGRLADRWGRPQVMISGGLIIVVSAVLAPLSTQVAPLAFSLFLLGLGWNLSFVGGSALLTDQLSPAERARVQGFNDLLTALASAGGSFGSGMIYAAQGYGFLNLMGGAMILLPITLTVWWLWRQRRLLVASAS